MKKHLRLFIFICTILPLTSFAQAEKPVAGLSGPQLNWIMAAYTNLYLAEQLDTQWNGTPSVPVTLGSTEEETKLFNDSIDHFYEEMQNPSFNDQTVKGVIGQLKATGYAYVRQKGAAYAVVYVLTELGDLSVIGFSLITGNVALLSLVTTVPFQTTFMAGYVGLSELVNIKKSSAAFGGLREQISFMLSEYRTKRALHYKKNDRFIPLSSSPGTIARVSDGGILQKVLTFTHLSKAMNQKSMVRFIKANNWWDAEMETVLEQNTTKQIRAAELIRLLEKKNPAGLEEAMKAAFPKAIVETSKIRNPEILNWGMNLVQATSDQSAGMSNFYQALETIPANTSPTVFMQFWKKAMLPFLATQRTLIRFKQFRKLTTCFNVIEGKYYSAGNATFDKDELELFKNYVHTAIDQETCVALP
jgi:hypothetical protein